MTDCACVKNIGFDIVVGADQAMGKGRRNCIGVRVIMPDNDMTLTPMRCQKFTQRLRSLACPGFIRTIMAIGLNGLNRSEIFDLGHM